MTHRSSQAGQALQHGCKLPFTPRCCRYDTPRSATDIFSLCLPHFVYLCKVNEPSHYISRLIKFFIFVMNRQYFGYALCPTAKKLLRLRETAFPKKKLLLISVRKTDSLYTDPVLGCFRGYQSEFPAESSSSGLQRDVCTAAQYI